MNGVPEGFEPTDDPEVFDYNPHGFVPSPEQQALIDAATRNALELAAIPEAERDYITDPAKYAAPIGLLTEDEERERARAARRARPMPDHCEACRAALLPGAEFCTSCGSRVAAGCRSCGRPLVPGAVFCVECGAPQTVPEPTLAPVATGAAAQATALLDAPPAERFTPPPIAPIPPASGPRLSTRTLGLIGGGVAVVLLVLVAITVATRGKDTPKSAPKLAEPRAATSTATVTAAPTETATPESTPTPEPPANTLPETPSENPNELAAEVDQAEETLHDPATGDADLEAAGRYEQMATRRLYAGDAAFRRSAFAAMGADAHSTMRATTDAAKALAVVVEPQKKFPKWKIVSPPPPQTLLRYFESAADKTGVPWEYLAAIQFVETKFGRIDGVSTAGARGPMQFLPATWARYGSGDVEDQRDSILGAARYLVANGAPADMPGALFHYNPSRGYVRAIRFYAERMRADRQAFFGFYAWQVLYKHVDGTMILPEGYPEVRPVPVPVE